MSGEDGDLARHLEGWDPGPVESTGRIDRWPVEAFAALLDRPPPDVVLPPLWHWFHLLDHPAQAALGGDGHPARGRFLPPLPERRRMFAGGRLEMRGSLRMGDQVTRRSSLVAATAKTGRSGAMVFVTVRHEFRRDGGLVVVEEQDHAYRSQPAGAARALPPGRSAPASAPLTGPVPVRVRTGPASPRAPAPWRLGLNPDEAMLFRFSALTYNAHRIHYDHGWVREEGYADLVVHGPLQALMMAELMRREGVDLVGRQYAYRLVSPMIGPQVLTVHAAPQGLSMGAETRDAQGQVTAGSTLTALDPQS